MKYYTIKPTEKLADYVRYFWIFEGSATDNQPYIHRTLANGCPELLFHYQGTFNELINDKFQTSFITGIHGQTSQHRRFITKKEFGIFGAYLYPHAVSVLFGLPAIELTNQLPDLMSILKKSDKHIEEKILGAKDNEQRLSIITHFLEQKVKKFERPEIAFAVKSILNSNGQINIKQLSVNCNLSLRQFERKFKEQTGFNPKLFARIIRFNSTIQKSNLTNSLTEIAYDFGYYDQSHFIQDFKEFSGYNPKTYFSGKANELLYTE